MPYETRFAASDSAFYFRGTGVVTGIEILEAARSLRSLVQESEVTRILIDLSSVTTVEISTPQVRELAAISVDASKQSQAARLALAAPQPQAFGLARMWDVFMEGSAWDIRLFQDRDAAADWLDLSLLPTGSLPAPRST